MKKKKSYSFGKGRWVNGSRNSWYTVTLSWDELEVDISHIYLKIDPTQKTKLSIRSQKRLQAENKNRIKASMFGGLSTNSLNFVWIFMKVSSRNFSFIISYQSKSQIRDVIQKLKKYLFKAEKKKCFCNFFSISSKII